MSHGNNVNGLNDQVRERSVKFALANSLCRHQKEQASPVRPALSGGFKVAPAHGLRALHAVPRLIADSGSERNLVAVLVMLFEYDELVKSICALFGRVFVRSSQGNSCSKKFPPVGPLADFFLAEKR
jgi:hypothetical protein